MKLQVSVARTSHVNVVFLLGFVYYRKDELLFMMPDGPLENFIQHCGCTAQILRSDIKPALIISFSTKNFAQRYLTLGLQSCIYSRKESIYCLL